MPHDIRSPHIFQDGPGNNASGEEVMDNFDALWTKVDSAAWVTLANLVSKIVYGSVAGATGAIINAGSGGWTSSRTSAGVLVVTFSPAFGSTPFVIPMAIFAGGALTTLLAAAPTTTTAVVNTNLVSSGAGTNADINFIAIGAR